MLAGREGSRSAPVRWASSPDALSAHRGMSGPVGSLRAGSLTRVSTDQLDPHDNSPVNSLPQVGPGVQGRQGNERVEGVERKGVPVGQAPQRTGSGIADNIEIVERDGRCSLLIRYAGRVTEVTGLSGSSRSGVHRTTQEIANPQSPGSPRPGACPVARVRTALLR